MLPQIQDYIRLGVTIVFLGIFTYQVVTGQAVNPIVERYLVLLLGFWFGLDRIGDFAGKFVTRQRAIKANRKK